MEDMATLHARISNGPMHAARTPQVLSHLHFLPAKPMPWNLLFLLNVSDSEPLRLFCAMKEQAGATESCTAAETLGHSATRQAKSTKLATVSVEQTVQRLKKKNR
jgi:hypothetical protein